MKIFLTGLFIIFAWVLISHVLQKRGRKSMGSHRLVGTPENIKASTKELDNLGITNLRGYNETVWAIHPLRKHMRSLKKICEKYNLELIKD